MPQAADEVRGSGRYAGFAGLARLATRNLPEHQECAIYSAGRREVLLFITVPDRRELKNRAHLDLRPVDRSREEEAERVIALGATQVAATGGPAAGAGSRSPIPRGTSSAS